MGIVAIRGAITVENNTVSEISAATVELYKEIIARNQINSDAIINIIFSMTKDLNAIYPAKALRENLNLADVPFMCVQEADVFGSLNKCIRILVQVEADLNKSDVKHVYLKGAATLRPDLK